METSRRQLVVYAPPAAPSLSRGAPPARAFWRGRRPDPGQADLILRRHDAQTAYERARRLAPGDRARRLNREA